jgi:serine/threonine-protein kinase
MPRASCATSETDESPFELDKYVAGDRISDKYRLETPIGFGAMGVLWRAHNEALDAPVALKLIRRDSRWAWSAERLLREARVMASLRHSAIVRVFDYGMTTRRDPFIVMELLQGETLRDLLDRETTLSAVEAIRLLLPILEGLQCAHARGVVHRDLKPENIFLSRDDRGRLQPKLLDFGIAKLEGVASHLTTGGVLLGSPSYMSPEQAKGEDRLDVRVDVWAAAVVLYEMIAGDAPWDAANCPALLRAIVDDDAPSIVGIGGVDAHLWSILELGLAKKRENRWASCRDFGWTLANWLASRSIVDDVSGTSLANGWLAEGPTPGCETSALANHYEPPPAEASARSTLPISPLGKLTFLFVMLAASLVFVGFGHRRPPTALPVPPAPGALVQPMDGPPAPPPSVCEATPPADAPAPTTPAPTASTALRRPRKPASTGAKPVASSGVSAPLVRATAAPAPPRSARDMDFGF